MPSRRRKTRNIVVHLVVAVDETTTVNEIEIEVPVGTTDNDTTPTAALTVAVDDTKATRNTPVRPSAPIAGNVTRKITMQKCAERKCQKHDQHLRYAS